MRATLPQDSLFHGMTAAPAVSVADVPDEVKAQIQEEALLRAFHRLESALRLLLHATTPGREPESPERFRQILGIWRFELEHHLHLHPDTYSGAVRLFDETLQSAYLVRGRCGPGDLVRIRVPCWRLRDHVVVRGEAELLDPEEIAIETVPGSEGSGEARQEVPADGMDVASPPEAALPPAHVESEASRGVTETGRSASVCLLPTFADDNGPACGATAPRPATGEKLPDLSLGSSADATEGPDDEALHDAEGEGARAPDVAEPVANSSLAADSPAPVELWELTEPVAEPSAARRATVMTPAVRAALDASLYRLRFDRTQDGSEPEWFRAEDGPAEIALEEESEGMDDLRAERGTREVAEWEVTGLSDQMHPSLEDCLPEPDSTAVPPDLVGGEEVAGPARCSLATDVVASPPPTLQTVFAPAEPAPREALEGDETNFGDWAGLEPQPAGFNRERGQMSVAAEPTSALVRPGEPADLDQESRSGTSPARPAATRRKYRRQRIRS